MHEPLVHPNDRLPADWTHGLPRHWAAKRLKFCLKTALAYGANEAAEEADPDEPRFIRITDLSDDGSLRAETFRSIEAEKAKAYLLSEGDLLLARSGATVGKSFLYRSQMGPAAYAGYLIRARLGSQLMPQFLQYFFQSNVYRQWIQSIFIQATIQNISAEKYANLVVPLPPLDEQGRLLNFLDRETSRIDALIDKKQRLLELLEEKRLAIITHAVTRGLDPNASMKPANGYWLSDLPADWDLIRIANLTYQITNGYVGPTRDILVDDGIRYIQSLHIKKGKILFDRGHYFVEEQWSFAHPKSILRRGDVLVVQTGEIGQTALVGEAHEGCNCHALIIIRPRLELMRGAFLELYLRSDIGQKYLASIQTGALHPHLNCTIIRDLYVPTPPTLDEQAAIVDYIQEAVEPLDRAVSQNERAIALLQEYRSALITNVVTGKIDVREEVEKEAAA